MHGVIDGSKPQTIYPYHYPVAYNLKVDDIDGTNVGSKNRINKFHSAYDSNLNVHDVPGAEVGSLKKGIVTGRHTNPVNPNYKYIGESELGLTNLNNPYGKKEEMKHAASNSHIEVHKIESTYQPKIERVKLTPPEPRRDDEPMTELGIAR